MTTGHELRKSWQSAFLGRTRFGVVGPAICNAWDLRLHLQFRIWRLPRVQAYDTLTHAWLLCRGPS